MQALNGLQIQAPGKVKPGKRDSESLCVCSHFVLPQFDSAIEKAGITKFVESSTKKAPKSLPAQALCSRRAALMMRPN
jgi:hypothetical protein